MRFLSLTFVGCLAVFGFLDAPQNLAAYAKSFTTSKGYTVNLTKVSGMGCEQMAQTLGEIDATRYRTGDETSVVPADRALYDYERKLSRAYHEKCGVKPLGGAESQGSDGLFQRMIKSP